MVHASYCRMINSLCLIRLSALGDVLMTVPLIKTLQANMPNLQLTWIISRPGFDLVEGMDGVEFIVIDKPKNLRDYWQFKQQMSTRSFDVLLAPQATFRSNLLSLCIKAKRKIGYDALRADDGQKWFTNERVPAAQLHTLEGFLQFAQALGIDKPVIRWDMPLTEVEHQWAAAQLPVEGPILVVNPVASKPERSWLPERYIDVLQQAQAKWQLQVVLVGGPGAADRDMAATISAALPVINLVGKTKPKQLLAVIARATAVLCPDTGPSHMAAAMNTPVVALHAVTNPGISGPYGFQQMVVDRYPDAVEKILGLSMENNVWGNQVHGMEAMQLITVDDVMHKLTEVFDNPEQPSRDR